MTFERVDLSEDVTLGFRTPWRSRVFSTVYNRRNRSRSKSNWRYNLKVTIENPMGIEWAQRARRRCGATRDETPLQLWRERHSVIYAVIFWIDIEGISERVHTHLVRSHVGYVPWVTSQRPDRGGVSGLRDMSIMCNAEALINLAQKRLCRHAWSETQEVVLAIREEVRKLQPELAELMQPRCVWERGCREKHSCGYYQGQRLAGDQ